VLAFGLLSLVSFELPSTGGTIRISIDWAAEWQQVLVHQPLEIAVFGILAGIVLTTCRATSRQLLPGVEEPDGKVVRVPSDVMDGNIALPAPNHFRYASRNWKLFCTVGEKTAAVNISVLMNGIFQPLEIALLSSSSDGTSKMFTDATLDAPRVIVDASPLIYLLAAMRVALPTAFRALQGSRYPWDGIPAECRAGIRTKQMAGAYFNMNPPEKSQGADSSLEATQALESLVDGWTEKLATMSMKRLHGNSNSWHGWAAWRVPWHGKCQVGPWRRQFWLVLSRQEKPTSFETNKSRLGKVCSQYKLYRPNRWYKEARNEQRRVSLLLEDKYLTSIYTRLNCSSSQPVARNCELIFDRR
jgi:hypothetical protein